MLCTRGRGTSKETRTYEKEEIKKRPTHPASRSHQGGREEETEDANKSKRGRHRAKGLRLAREGKKEEGKNESTLRKNLTKKRGRKRRKRRGRSLWGKPFPPPQKRLLVFKFEAAEDKNLRGKIVWKEKGRSSMKKKLKRKKRR